MKIERDEKGRLKVEVLGYEAAIVYIAPHAASPPEHLTEYLSVFIEFPEGKNPGSTAGFAVYIPLRDYSYKDFIDIVRMSAGDMLRRIMLKDDEERRKKAAEDEQRKVMNKVTSDLGDKLGVDYLLREG